MATKDTTVTSPDEPETASPAKRVSVPKKSANLMDAVSLEARRQEHERRVRGGK